MEASLETTALSLPELNEVKNKLATAFLYSLNSTTSYRVQEMGRDYDNVGIDFKILNFPMGKNRLNLSDENEINIQLKGVSVDSASMLSESVDSLTYNLGAIVPIATHYIFLVVMPSKNILTEWRSVSEEEVVLKCRGYYYLLEDRHDGGNITIPRLNRLTVETYKDIFLATRQRI